MFFKPVFYGMVLTSLAVSASADETTSHLCPADQHVVWSCGGAAGDEMVSLCADHPEASLTTILGLYRGKGGQAEQLLSATIAEDMVATNRFASNYDITIETGSLDVRIFEDIRSDDDVVTLISNGTEQEIWCASTHDRLTEY